MRRPILRSLTLLALLAGSGIAVLTLATQALERPALHVVSEKVAAHFRPTMTATAASFKP